MITVKIYQSAAIRSRSNRREFTVPYQQGMIVLDVIRGEFEEKHIKSLMVMVNDAHQARDVALNDGDSVSIMSIIAGG